jgi:hypothetical protein
MAAPASSSGTGVRGPRRGRAGSPAEQFGWGAIPAGVLDPPVNQAPFEPTFECVLVLKSFMSTAALRRSGPDYRL